MEKVLVISVKPEYAEKIFDGTKTIELRKASPKVQKNDIVLIYSTSPVKAVVGYCKVKSIIKMEPQLIWQEHGDKLGISKRKFFEYYHGWGIAVGIVLMQRYLFREPISLDDVRKRIRKFSPPQTFKYLDQQQFRKIA